MNILASPLEIFASIFLGLAVIHTFLTNRFQAIANRFPEGSVRENLFHLLGEVEVTFGLWAGGLILLISMMDGPTEAVGYLETLHFNEPLFVFVIMVICSTKPISWFAEQLISTFARMAPVSTPIAFYISCLVIGPLVGSFITEPAAMTLTALILRRHYFEKKVSDRFKYVTLAVLFVNVSIGGALTPYAAPPILMVASTWGWDLPFMFFNFGWKVMLAVAFNAIFALSIVVKELVQLRSDDAKVPLTIKVPLWIVCLHLVFLILVVATAHHPTVFMGLFLFFLGVVTITREFQNELKLRESLLVGFFLGGLIVLGGLQAWWVQPLLARLDPFAVFLSTTGLTAFTDNATLTYLGSQVKDISEGFKYALVAGAIAGGGLTVIANAPNPAGYSLLQDRFGPTGIHAVRLVKWALLPTLVSMGCLWGF